MLSAINAPSLARNGARIAEHGRLTAFTAFTAY
jgi:hypothetical protein